MFKIIISTNDPNTPDLELRAAEGMTVLPPSVQDSSGYDRLVVLGRHRLLIGSRGVLRWSGPRHVKLGGLTLQVTSTAGIRTNSEQDGRTTRRINRRKANHRFEARPAGAPPVALDDYIALVGRDAECDIILSDSSVSRFHAALLASKSHVTVQDLSSANGTFLNGNRIQTAQILAGRIGLGDSLLGIGRVRQSSRPIDLPSRAMRRIYETVSRIAYSDVSVVILGESGTGKDVIARRLHEESGRTGRFIAINAAAITSSLSSSELFGHKKGSYTGAIDDHKGAFREADGGTLFLDEIGDMPLSLQADVLRAVEEKRIRPVGSSETHDVDVRIIAATNRDLEHMVLRGEFREDLYHRLTVIPIEIPPLRERPEDIAVLIEHFLGNLDIPRSLSLKALETLQKHAWPGNVRELSNVLMRAAVISDKLVLEVADFTIKKPEAMATPIGDLIHDVVIETYLRLGSAVETAKVLGLRRPVVRHHIDLWQKRQEKDG